MDVKARALLTAQERTAEKDHGWSEDQRVVRKHGRGWLSTRLVVDQTVTTTLVQEVHMLVTSYSITLYCPNCRGFHPIILYNLFRHYQVHSDRANLFSGRVLKKM